MKNKKYWLLTSAATLLPMVLGLLLWDKLPARIPTHFGIDGAADGWGSKGFAVFGVPAMWLSFHLIIWGVTRLDRQNRGHNEKVLNLTGLVFPAMSIIFAVIMYSQALKLELNLSMLLFPLLGLFLIAMGNWLPKIKQNTTLGIKLRWTLYNEENWNKTHRFAGFVWVIGGVLLCVLGFLPGEAVAGCLVGTLALMALLPILYSCKLAKKQQREGTWTESQLSKKMKKHPVVLAVTMVLVVLLLAGVAFIMFTGDIAYTCTGTALVIEADFHADSTVPYEQIDSVVLRDSAPEGIREWGFASARLMMGAFKNDEFGSHTRYSYTGTEAYIVLNCGGEVIILSAETEDATRALYEELTELLQK